MPYLMQVVKGKEKRVVEVFGQHRVVAIRALIGEYVVCYDPKSEELRFLDSIAGYIRDVSRIEDEEVGRFLGMSEAIYPTSDLETGQIVRVLSGEYEDFRGVVRRAEDGKVALDVIVFGRLRPVFLNRDQVASDGIPEGWGS
jgi:transcription antitermination factor NusG